MREEGRPRPPALRWSSMLAAAGRSACLAGVSDAVAARDRPRHRQPHLHLDPGRAPAGASGRNRPASAGLALAMLTRIALLFSHRLAHAAWCSRCFMLRRQGVSGRDLVLLGGGLFLLAKSVLEIHQTLEGAGARPQRARLSGSFTADHRADRPHRYRLLARLGVHRRRAREGPDASWSRRSLWRSSS